MKRFLGLALFVTTISANLACCYASQVPVEQLKLTNLEAQKPGQTVGSPMPTAQEEVNHFSETQIRQSSKTETENVKRFHEIMEQAISYNLSDTSMGQIMQAVAEQFLGADYKAGLLDRSERETLFISLKNFDCVIFIETVLAIARNIALKDYRYQTFTNHIVGQRYRNGDLNGYCSRLHYFLEWINDNQRRGTVQNMAPDLGGISLKKKLNFMSTNPSRYPQLANNNANYQCIVEMEANLQPLKIDYIPKNQIKRIYGYLQPGDIIGIATNIPGLDTTHTGLIYRSSEGQTGLLHASPAGKVTVAPDLQRYVNNVKHSTGILIARPIDPRQIKTAN